jgi:hypothetical protein
MTIVALSIIGYVAVGVGANLAGPVGGETTTDSLDLDNYYE